MSDDLSFAIVITLFGASVAAFIFGDPLFAIVFCGWAGFVNQLRK